MAGFLLEEEDNGGSKLLLTIVHDGITSYLRYEVGTVYLVYPQVHQWGVADLIPYSGQDRISYKIIYVITMYHSLAM